MPRQVRKAVAPTYLFLCLLLGGSAQGVWANMILQLLGLGILAWAAIDRPAEPLPRPARQLLWLLVAGIAFVAMQLVPLPAALWTSFGNRGFLAVDYAALGLAPPSLPISLTPYATLSSLLSLIPPLAIGLAILRLHAFRPSWLVAALALGTLSGVLLGVLQVASGDSNSPFYFYRYTNVGVATGFFANANHFAILLVATIPFLAAIAAKAKDGDRQRFSAVLFVCVLLTAIIVVGIALNRSLAAALLVLPVLAASSLLVVRASNRARRFAAAAAAVLLIAGIGILASTSVADRSIGADARTSVQSRSEIFGHTVSAIGDFLPFGSGVGSFRPGYRLYEDQGSATTTFVNHAHDDYAELVLELGLPGAMLIVLFLIWWGAAVSSAWRSAELKPYVRAASIASAAILAHSIVDFPLRTEAMLAVFAMCLALLADRAKAEPAEPNALRPARHAVLK